MKELTGEDKINTEKVEHETVNYVDDSNNCIIFEDPSEVDEYLDNFFKVLTAYYNLSKLKLNEDKTALMISSKPKHREEYKDVTIKTNEDEDDVKQQKQVKILGFLTNQRGNNDSQISKVISEVSHMFNIANKSRKYMNDRTRKAFINCHVMGKLNYNFPLISAGTKFQ